MEQAVRFRATTWLRRHATGAALIALLVAVTLAPAVTLIAGARRTGSAPDRYVAAEASPFDVMTWQTDGDLLTDEIASLPGVDDVAQATFLFAALAPDGAAPLEALTFAGRIEAVGGRLFAGREPSRSETSEFAASDSWVALGDYEVGDTFTLVTISGSTARETGYNAEFDGPSTTATLVGVFQNRVQDLEEPTPVAVFGSALLDAFGPGAIGTSGTSGMIDLAEGVGLDDFRRRLDAVPGGDRIATTPAELIGQPVLSAVSTQADALWVLAAIASAAALVLLTQVLVRLVRTSASERAVLGALGYTARQASAETVMRATPPILTGVAAGSVIAWLCSGRFPHGFATVVEPQPGRRFDPIVHGGAAALFTLVLLVGVGLFGRERSTQRRRRRTFDQLAARAPSPTAATGVRLAFGRGRDTQSTNSFVVGLGVVLSIAVAGLTVGHSLGSLLDAPANWGADFDVGYGSGGEQIGDDVIDALRTDPAVRAITLYAATTIDVDGEPLGVVAYTPIEGGEVPRALDGRLPLAGDEVALGTSAARRFDVGVGDALEVRSADGDVGLTVVGIAVFAGIEETDGIGDAALVNAAGLERLDRDDAFSSAAVYFVDDAPADTAARLSAALGGDELEPFDTPSAVVNLARVRNVPFLVMAVVGAMALLSLTLVVATSVRHGRHELSVLRALGATTGWRRRAVLWQATVLGSVVSAIAVVIGVIIGRFAYSAYPTRIGAPVEPHIPLAQISLVAAGALVVAMTTAVATMARPRNAAHDLNLE